MTYVNQKVIFFIGILVVLTAQMAAARQDVVLPELAPREVEITGDLTIVFPALSRQPLVGFNPPPTVPDISAARRPFAEAYKQPSADLPPSPVVPPDPPAVSALASREPMDGLMTLSFGRYLDRRFTADIALVNSVRTSSVLNLDYHGSNGHEPFAASNASSGFERIKGGLKSTSRTGKVLLSTSLDGFMQSYSLFGLTANPGSQSVSNPDRTFSGADASLGIGTLPGTRAQASAVLNGGFARLDSDIFDIDLRTDPTSTRDETFLSAELNVSLPIQDGFVSVSGTGTTSGLDSGSFPGTMIQSGYSQALVSYLYSRRLNVKAGVAVVGFASDAQTVSDRSRSLAYLSPVVELRYAATPFVSVFGGNQPALDSGLMRDAYHAAPYLADEPLLLPSITSIDAHAGVDFLSRLITSKVQFGYREQPNRRYAFLQTGPVNGYSSGYPSFGYETVTVTYGKVDVGVVLSPGIQLGLDAEYRQAELSRRKVDVPYLSPLTLGGFASASFMDGEANVKLDFRHEGARTIDLAGLVETGSLTLFGLEGSYYFTPTYGVTLGVRNLGASPEFWQLYPLESSTFYVGGKFRW